MKFVRTDKAPEPGCYSQAVSVDVGTHSLLFLSGQTGNVPGLANEPVVWGGVGQQTTRALKNILAIVEEAGGSTYDIVDVKVFLKDSPGKGEKRARARTESRVAFAEAYKRFFESHGRSELMRNLPARTMVWVSEVPLEYPTEETLIEITAMAVIPRQE